MKWLFRWMRDGINTIDKEDRAEESNMVGAISINKAARPRGIHTAKLRAGSDDGSISLQQHPMHFRIYPATGGHIIEYTYYNERKDTNDQALHLIPSDLDLGAELAKIMTLEAFKR